MSSSHETVMQVAERFAVWNNFQECLLENVRLSRYGASFDFIVNYVWSVDGSLRTDALSIPKLICIRCELVYYLQFIGELTSSMRTEPASIDWGISEISCFQVMSPETVLGTSECKHVGPEAIAIGCLWESSRRWIVVCSEVLIQPVS